MATDNPLSDHPDLRSYTYWVRERLAKSGLAQRLIAEEELQPHPQSLQLVNIQKLLPVKTQSLPQRAKHVADNLNHYVGSPETFGVKNDPVIRSFAVAAAFLGTFLLASLTLAVSASLTVSIVLAVLLLPALLLLTLLLSPSGAANRSAVNRREFYAYLLESYSDPPEPSTRPVRTGHRPRQRLR